eukprot:10217565-Ditylum_brightwellii.AAC.1
MRGLEQWMGRDLCPNLGLDYRILHLILANIETDMLDSSWGQARIHFLLLVGFYLVRCFTASLRGNEGFIMETQGLIQHKNDWKFEEKEDLKH